MLAGGIIAASDAIYTLAGTVGAATVTGALALLGVLLTRSGRADARNYAEDLFVIVAAAVEDLYEENDELRGELGKPRKDRAALREALANLRREIDVRHSSRPGHERTAPGAPRRSRDRRGAARDRGRRR